MGLLMVIVILAFPYVASGPAHRPTSEVSGADLETPVEDLWACHEQGVTDHEHLFCVTKL